MALGVSSLVLLFIIVSTFPTGSFGSLRSWFCGTCTSCQSCPACEPHFNVSPKCECQENLNNCNCNCVNHENVQEYHQQWNLRIMANQNNTHAAQMNNHLVKQHLLVWLLGLSFFIIFMLVIVVLFIIFTPTLLRHCGQLRKKSKILRRQHLIKKHNLVDLSTLSNMETESPQSLSTICANLNATVTSPTSAPTDLLHQLEAQHQMIIKLQRDLEAERTLRKTITFAPRPNIF